MALKPQASLGLWKISRHAFALTQPEGSFSSSFWQKTPRSIKRSPALASVSRGTVGKLLWSGGLATSTVRHHLPQEPPSLNLAKKRQAKSIIEASFRALLKEPLAAAHRPEPPLDLGGSLPMALERKRGRFRRGLLSGLSRSS